LKSSKHNYQLDQVLENFKYSFYFDGITSVNRGDTIIGNPVVYTVAHKYGQKQTRSAGDGHVKRLTANKLAM